MIPANVDLTKHLDFKNDRPVKEILAGFPWKRKNRITKKYNYINNFEPNDTIQYISTRTNYTISNEDHYSYHRIYNFENNQWDAAFGMPTTLYINDNNSPTSSSTASDVSIYYTMPSIVSSENSDDKSILKCKPKHIVPNCNKACFICGKKFISNGARVCKECNSEIRLSIPSEFRRSARQSKNIHNAVALYDGKRNLNNPFNFKPKNKRSIHVIPWLDKLRKWNRTDYLKELRDGEQNYDAFLTDLSWFNPNN